MIENLDLRAKLMLKKVIQHILYQFNFFKYLIRKNSDLWAKLILKKAT